MNRRLRYSLIVIVLAHAPAASAQDRASSFKATVKPFLDAHCVDCHGPNVKKAGLRLDELKADFADSAAAPQWIKVLDRIDSGEMPPKGRQRPDPKSAGAVTQFLRTALHEASLETQRKQGRVVLRRLNRTEYETTLRDLLGPQVDVKDLLPEDSSAAGFDNVSAVLDVSAVHLLRYQEAAEKALRSAIPTRPAADLAKHRRSGREVAQKSPFHLTELIDKVARFDGDTMIMFVRPWGHMPVATPPAPVAGRYRVRASGYAVQTEGKPLPVMLSCRDLYGREDNDMRAVRDVPSGKAIVIEEEVALKAREMIVFAGWTLPALRAPNQLGMPVEQYKGPGLAVEWVEIEGPLDAWPPAGYQRLFGDVPLKPRSVAKLEAEGKPVPPQPAKRPENWWIYDPLVIAPTEPKKDADRLIRAFLPVAFRRPVEEKLQQYYVKIVHDALDRKLAFEEAMLLGYKAALCSPHFLYLVEPVEFGKSTALDNHAIASRLSYFLWSSLPDRELFDWAAKGELTKPAVVRAQVERLLKDAKARRFTANFAGQWLDLRLINATSPDPQIYIEYDPFLYWSMPRETEAFFEAILREDRSLLEFVDSDWTFLNERLAQHYGIAEVAGGELRKVKLPADSHRGGVMTHASILKVTADGTRTSPVLRGKWVLDRMVGKAPSPPPPGTPAIDPDIRGASTIRQQLDKHRHTPACAACHRHIDPPGFALENFDAIGGWRDFYRVRRALKPGEKQIDLANYPDKRIFRGLDVEKGGELADGRAFKNIDEYRQLLLTDKDQIARNLAQKLLIYATGADIQFADREVVEQLVARSREQKYGFRSLIHEVVQSRVFWSK
jgi:mono/diheme cytochrome c family protein